MTTEFHDGEIVHPTDKLVDLRPELAGSSGHVECCEGDEVVVDFVGQRRYRVSTNLVSRPA